MAQNNHSNHHIYMAPHIVLQRHWRTSQSNGIKTAVKKLQFTTDHSQMIMFLNLLNFLSCLEIKKHHQWLMSTHQKNIGRRQQHTLHVAQWCASDDTDTHNWYSSI